MFHQSHIILYQYLFTLSNSCYYHCYYHPLLLVSTSLSLSVEVENRTRSNNSFD